MAVPMDTALFRMTRCVGRSSHWPKTETKSRNNSMESFRLKFLGRPRVMTEAEGSARADEVDSELVFAAAKRPGQASGFVDQGIE